MDNKQKIELLKMLNRRKNFMNEIKKNTSEDIDIEFISIRETEKIQKFAYQQIDRKNKVVNLSKNMDLTLKHIFNNIENVFEKLEQKKVIILHYQASEIGAIEVALKELISYLQDFLEIIGFINETSDLICVSVDYSFGLCLEFLEYENLFTFWKPK